MQPPTAAPQVLRGALAGNGTLLPPDPNVPADLAAAGFRLILPGTIRPRIIASIAGWEGSGKTHRALQMPGPIAYLNIDQGTEGVVEKFQKGFDGQPPKTVYDMDLRMGLHVINPATKDEMLTKEAVRVWNAIDASYHTALASPGVRTVVVDTESEAWEILRLARFGKTTQVPPDLYTFVNSEMRGLVMDAVNSDKNVIFLRKMKEEWADEMVAGQRKSRKTGKHQVVGFKETQYAVQVALRVYREPGGGQWHTVVEEKCRPNPMLVGADFVGAAGDMANLLPLVFLPQGGEGTSPDYWR